jgi:hypothetical protein
MSAAFGLKQATKPCITEPVTQHEHGAIPPSAHARAVTDATHSYIHTYTSGKVEATQNDMVSINFPRSSVSAAM